MVSMPVVKSLVVLSRHIPSGLALVLCLSAVHAAENVLKLPSDIRTVDDGRAAIRELYDSYATLLDKGWILDVIASSKPEGTSRALPIFALRTGRQGPATWIISGIHGEEPAGPNAIAGTMDEIATLGDRQPVVLIPLANPHGYVRNWRYLNSPVWSEALEAQSVGDSSHKLPDPDNPRQARAALASSPEAGAITRYIVATMPAYPPRISLDLHEDDKISAAYVYSQGEEGAADQFAAEAVRVLMENAIPIKLDGFTRFDEKIIDGIIGPVTDSSIDELMSAKQIIDNGALQVGPAAPTVLVFETPAASLSLARRISAHEALLRRMIDMLADAGH